MNFGKNKSPFSISPVFLLQITIKCKCGNRSGKALCMIGGDNKDYNRMATMMMAMKMSDMQSGQSIDISNLTGGDSNKKKTRQ